MNDEFNESFDESSDLHDIDKPADGPDIPDEINEDVEGTEISDLNKNETVEGSIPGDSGEPESVEIEEDIEDSDGLENNEVEEDRVEEIEEDTEDAVHPEDTDAEANNGDITGEELSDSPAHYNSLQDYMNDHNYGPDDFATYSQDPVWRQLHAAEYPDYEMPPLSQESAQAQLSSYMNEHNYGRDDFATYSQDPKWRELQAAAFPDYKMPPLESRNSSTETSAEENDIKNIDDVSSWINEINPNFDAYDPESPYCNNCGSCALAVHQRLEGSTDSCASAENIGYNDEMNALTGMEQVPMKPEEIESRLLSEGNGAHAIIGIDRAEGPGHWFNAACIDGKVVAIDGQTGEITDWPPDYGDVVNWEMSVKKGDKDEPANC